MKDRKFNDPDLLKVRIGETEEIISFYQHSLEAAYVKLKNLQDLLKRISN